MRLACAAAAVLLGCGGLPPTTPPSPDVPAMDVPVRSDIVAPVERAPLDAGAPAVDAPSAEVGAPRPMNVDATLVERVPVAFAPLQLPDGAEVVAAWVGPEGDAVIASRGGALYGVDVYGALREVERIPGDPRGPGDAPVSLVTERNATTPLLLTPGGGLLVQDGWAQRAQLPAILRGARANARWGEDALWATGTALYTTDGPRWLQLDRAEQPVTDVVAMVPGAVGAAARDVWVLRADGTLEDLRLTRSGEAVSVRWTEPLPGISVGPARAIAALGDRRYVAREDDLLRVRGGGPVERLRVPGEFSGPVALTAAGPWLWAAWDNGDSGVDLGRIGADGAVEVVARGVMPFARGVRRMRSVRIAADTERGETAVVILRAEVPAADGGVGAEEARAVRVVVQPRVALAGVAEAADVTFARVPLRAAPPRPDAVEAVDFALDGTRVETVTTPPFAWGGMGRVLRDLPTLEFGAHTVNVTVRYRGAEPLRRARTFRYLSPLGRVPTYDQDIAPVYESRCARCHSTGIARDLRGYDRLRAQGASVAQALLGRRMPPDLAVDEPTVQLFTSWVSGNAPR